MVYFVSFLEGIITFVSPCLLPMLPIYISYFAGNEEEQAGTKTVVKNALGFVLGFTAVFLILGAFAGTVGSFLKSHQMAVNIVTGAIVVIFGLGFLEVFQLRFFKGIQSDRFLKDRFHFLSAFLFGMVFSISWTPCVGAFLGSALMLASQQGSVFKGVVMLLCYSMGLGIPFVVSAVLLDQMKGMFGWIKQNYKIVQRISGTLLIIVGILMMTGRMGYFLTLLS